MGDRRSGRQAALITAVAMVSTIPAFAQDPGSRQTRDFVQTAAQSDEFEVLEAESAIAASKDPEVQAFAHRMIEDHRRMRETLKAAAAQSGLRPPAPGVAGDQSMFLAALQSLRGVEFDRAYAKQQVLAHRAALGVEQIYASSGDDPSIRKLAGTAIPMIQSHETAAERIAARLGGS